jgi:hypothetical protein
MLGCMSMRIGQVARSAGVRTSLVRYYERIGLRPEADRVSGQRRYDAAVLRRIEALIDRAQQVRAWLQTATTCGCQTIDECALFDAATLAMQPSELAITHVPRRTRA